MTDQTFPEAMVEIVARAICNAECKGDRLDCNPCDLWHAYFPNARAALAALADAGFVIMPREVVDVLAWATPLAELATESHRLERVRCGHNDIRGTYKNGQTWVGIYQSEVDQIEQAREVCRAMRDAAMGGKG